MFIFDSNVKICQNHGHFFKGKLFPLKRMRDRNGGKYLFLINDNAMKYLFELCCNFSTFVEGELFPSIVLYRIAPFIRHIN